MTIMVAELRNRVIVVCDLQFVTGTGLYYNVLLDNQYTSIGGFPGTGPLRGLQSKYLSILVVLWANADYAWSIGTLLLSLNFFLLTELLISLLLTRGPPH